MSYKPNPLSVMQRKVLETLAKSGQTKAPLIDLPASASFITLRGMAERKWIEVSVAITPEGRKRLGAER